MKFRVFTAIIIVIFVILLTTVVFAASGAVTLKSNVNKVKIGDTFTVTLSATSEDGINGIDTKIIYDSSKLELISEGVVDSSKWSNLGTSPDITIICNSMLNIKNADIYTLQFKVKDNVTVGDTIKVETSSITLDTDLQTNSSITIPAKKVELTIIEELKTNFNNYNEVTKNGVEYVEKIAPNTTKSAMIKNITTNGQINVYKNNQLITDNTIKMSTGMKMTISLYDESYDYTMVIKGDTNGDGVADLKDILQINKHRLNKSLLINEFLFAGDVNFDNAVDLKDLLQINKFRLGKINTL